MLYINGKTILDGVITLTEMAYIAMAEDAWIGIGGSAERIVFDGSGDQIDLFAHSIRIRDIADPELRLFQPDCTIAANLRYTRGLGQDDHINDILQFGLGQAPGGGAEVGGEQGIYQQLERSWKTGGVIYSEWWIGTIDTVGDNRRALMLTVDHNQKRFEWNTVADTVYQVTFTIDGNAPVLSVSDKTAKNATLELRGQGQPIWQLRDLRGVRGGSIEGIALYNAGADRVDMVVGQAVGIGTDAPSQALSFGGNAARTLWMERHTTADNAGNSLTVQSGGATSGATNKVGGALILKTGLGTGNAIPAQQKFLAPAQGTASGTANQNLVNRLTLNGTVALSSGVASTILTIPLATLQMGSGVLMYSVEAGDGTDVIAASGTVDFAAVNKGGVYTTNSNVLGTEAQALSDVTDTIVNTFGFSNGTNQTGFQITSTIVGMTATTHRITYMVISGAQQDISSP